MNNFKTFSLPMCCCNKVNQHKLTECAEHGNLAWTLQSYFRTFELFLLSCFCQRHTPLSIFTENQQPKPKVRLPLDDQSFKAVSSINLAPTQKMVCRTLPCFAGTFVVWFQPSIDGFNCNSRNEPVWGQLRYTVHLSAGRLTTLQGCRLTPTLISTKKINTWLGIEPFATGLWVLLVAMTPNGTTLPTTTFPRGPF